MRRCANKYRCVSGTHLPLEGLFAGVHSLVLRQAFFAGEEVAAKFALVLAVYNREII